MKNIVLLFVTWTILSGCNDKPEPEPSFNIGETKMIVYPNPAIHSATVHVDSNSPFTIQVFDTYGNLFLEEENKVKIQVDVTGKPKDYCEVIVTTPTQTLYQTLTIR